MTQNPRTTLAHACRARTLASGASECITQRHNLLVYQSAVGACFVRRLLEPNSSGLLAVVAEAETPHSDERLVDAHRSCPILIEQRYSVVQ